MSFIFERMDLKKFPSNDLSIKAKAVPDGLGTAFYSDLSIDSRFFYIQRTSSGVADLLLIHNPAGTSSIQISDISAGFRSKLRIFISPKSKASLKMNTLRLAKIWF